MIIEFFPTMTKVTRKSFIATLGILCDFFFNIPIFTLNSFKLSRIWSFIILPIVGINTSKFIMIIFRIRTKFWFEIIKEKVWILFHFMDKVDFNFIFGMSQSTKLFKFAFLTLQNIQAIFFFVIIWMVKLFDCIVWIVTIYLFAIFIRTELLAILVLIISSSFILVVMKVFTKNNIVLVFDCAKFCLIMFKVNLFFFNQSIFVHL